MAEYPSAVKSFSTRSAGDTIQPAHMNDVQAEITAIEQDILTNGITLTSGQIDFPATQVPSAGANVLDDYEEGSFTPTIISSGGGTPTYTTQVGRYIKIGRLVVGSGRVTLATKGTLAAGDVLIDDLPFTSDATADVFGALVIPYVQSLATSVSAIGGHVNTGGATASLTFLAAAGATASANVQVSDIAATFEIIFTFQYLAAA
jgi:hypothetical protein